MASAVASRRPAPRRRRSFRRSKTRSPPPLPRSAPKEDPVQEASSPVTASTNPAEDSDTSSVHSAPTSRYHRHVSPRYVSRTYSASGAVVAVHKREPQVPAAQQSEAEHVDLPLVVRSSAFNQNLRFKSLQRLWQRTSRETKCCVIPEPGVKMPAVSSDEGVRVRGESTKHVSWGMEPDSNTIPKDLPSALSALATSVTSCLDTCALNSMILPHDILAISGTEKADDDDDDITETDGTSAPETKMFESVFGRQDGFPNVQL